jgi:hypothetical protein
MNKIKKTRKNKRFLIENVKFPVGKQIVKDLDAEILFCFEKMKIFLKERDNDDYLFIADIFLEGDDSIYGVLKNLLDEQIGSCLISLIQAFYFCRYLEQEKASKNFNDVFILSTIFSTLLDNHLKIYYEIKFLVFMLKFYYSFDEDRLKIYVYNTLISLDKFTRKYILLNLFLVSNYTRVLYLLYDLEGHIRQFANDSPEEIFVETAGNFLTYRKNLSKKVLKCQISKNEKELLVLGIMSKLFESTNKIIDVLFTFRKRCVYSSKKKAMSEKDTKKGYKNCIPIVYENFEKFLIIKENMIRLFDKFVNDDILRAGFAVEVDKDEIKKVSSIGLFNDCLISATDYLPDKKTEKNFIGRLLESLNEETEVDEIEIKKSESKM